MKGITLAQLILACSLSSEPHVEDTLYRVVMATSQGHPYWMATDEGHLYTPETLGRAQGMLKGFQDAQHTVHIGLAALSSERLKDATLEPSRALDACTNIGIASLELESVLPLSSKKPQEMHEALALYFMPAHPTSLAALSMGARVLAIKQVNVREEADAEHPLPGPTYQLERSLFYEQGKPVAPLPAGPVTPTTPALADAPHTEDTPALGTTKKEAP